MLPNKCQQKYVLLSWGLLTELAQWGIYFPTLYKR